jgi:outer membrane protein assembly factor BamB
MMNGLAASVRNASACCVLLVCGTLTGGELAGTITRLAERDHGLCAIVGTGSPETVELATDLAATGRMIVHIVALDEPSVMRFEKAVEGRGLAGIVTVERLVVQPLPYRDDLVNILVVPDGEQAKAAGITQAEALRVVAPFGSLCIREGGEWQVVRKPVSPGMDEWTHNVHGPDGNRMSADTVVSFPMGYRWHAGLPFNISNRERTENRYAATRGLAVTGGRCFAFSDSVIENLRGTYSQGQGKDQYVTARDAFNGMLLWRRRIGATYYGGLWYMNLAPFVAVDDVVCTASEEGDLLVLDAATGDVRRTIDTTYAPGDLLIDRGIIATATWKDGISVGESKVNRYERRRMDSGIAEGTVEAYDLQTGRRLWRNDRLATSIRSADGLLFMVSREGPDRLEESRRFRRRGEEPPKDENGNPVVFTRPNQSVVAVDLATGKKLWEATALAFAGEESAREHLRLDAVGEGVVSVIHSRDLGTDRVTLLSAKTGQVVLQKKEGRFPVLAGGKVHLGGKTYDPATGAELSSSGGISIGSTVCTPSFAVNNMIVRNRGGGFSVDGRNMVYGGARGACSMASVPAFGAFYTAQNWCLCSPQQISGFISFGPVRAVPSRDEMVAEPTVVRGPAFAAAPTEDGEWPMFRYGPERGSACPTPAPAGLDVLWTRSIPSPPMDTFVTRNWAEYLNDPLTGPTVGNGVAVAAAVDSHQVVGIRLQDGEVVWRFTAGGRIDSSPTVYRGICLFGAHDGFVYALNAADGQLRWRMRMAPNDERMVSYGKVESPWPVIGTVLVADGVAYASAGRTQGSDGGLVVRAFSPETGAVSWTTVLEPGNNVRALRRNDLILKTGDALQLMITRLNPNTGETLANPVQAVHDYRGRVDRLKRDIATQTAALQGAGDGTDRAAGIKAKLEKLQNELAKQVEPPSERAPELGSGGTSSEGFVSWDWPRLGDRKFRGMAYGNVGGTLVSWDASGVCRMYYDRRLALYGMEKVGMVGEKLAARPDWSVELPAGYQVTSLVLCPDAVLVAGGIYGNDAQNVSEAGFVALFSRDKGEKTRECALPAPVSLGGVAVTGSGIVATLRDNTVCLIGASAAK